MKTLIVYGSTYGYAEDCARRLAALLPGPCEVVVADGAARLSLEDYEAVIIGGSIYMGKVQKAVSAFCRDREQELLHKRLGLFLCCGLPENLPQHLAGAFPESLRQSAVAVANFGGRLEPERMGLMHRTVTKMMLAAAAKEGRPPVAALPEALTAFAEALKA